MPKAVEESIEFVHKHLKRETVIGRVRRTERLTVPEVAIREAVINAVVHADYSQKGAPIRIAIFENRIELDNPGLLPFGLTIEDVQRGVSRLRNRVIGRVFHELRLIEQWGSGIQRMTSACRQAGLDDPRLEEIGTHFRLTLSFARTHKPTVDDADQKILTRLSSSNDGLSTAQLAKAVRLSARATRERLKQLVQRGLVVEVGSGPTDPRRLYFLAK